MNEGFRILDKKTQRFLDIFHVVLLYSAERTLLPEIYEVFRDREAIIRFIDIFSGRTVKIPDRRIIEEAIRDVEIYLRLSDSPTQDVAGDLAHKYEMERSDVWIVHTRTRERLENQRLEVNNGNNGHKPGSGQS
jgi:Mor family transcriptional regulator